MGLEKEKMSFILVALSKNPQQISRINYLSSHSIFFLVENYNLVYFNDQNDCTAIYFMR